MSKVKLKICGMNHNVAEIAALHPDYLGFIFYEHSPRNFTSVVPKLPANIKKVGVFVNADLSFIREKIAENRLDVIQLHGEESPEFCAALKDHELWKVFSIKDSFDFDLLAPYKEVADYFLFDTSGEYKGGTGLTFNWQLLNQYDLQIPIVLSGGIGMEQLDAIHSILKTDLPIKIIDVNSRFELAPGLKDSNLLKEFIDGL